MIHTGGQNAQTYCVHGLRAFSYGPWQQSNISEVKLWRMGRNVCVGFWTNSLPRIWATSIIFIVLSGWHIRTQWRFPAGGRSVATSAISAYDGCHLGTNASAMHHWLGAFAGLAESKRWLGWHWTLCSPTATNLGRRRWWNQQSLACTDLSSTSSLVDGLEISVWTWLIHMESLPFNVFVG